MARKKKAGSGVDPNAWMVTFSDLLTLLLTFFVLLISMSSLDSKKLKEAFETLVPIAGVDIMDGPPVPSTSNPQHKLTVLKRSLIQSIAVEQTKMGSDLVDLALPDGADSGYPNGRDGADGQTRTNGADRQEGDDEAVAAPAEGLEVFVDERGLIVRLPANVTFASGNAEVRPAFKALLRVIGNMMIERNLVATVEGHTDDRAISTLRYPSNWELSMARGAAAVRCLVDVAAVDPSRLAASGYGDRRPIAGNDTPEGRQQNRRIEVILNIENKGKVKNLTDPKQENGPHG